MTTNESADLRAAREHAALLRDLEALCRKYTACTALPQLVSDDAAQAPDWEALMRTSPGAMWALPPNRYAIPEDAARAGITYIAGPMSGIPEHNYPAFNAMAKRLRDAGLTVINPAEIHHDTEHPWDWYLRRDITELVKCSRVVFLDGWSTSRGARLEWRVAKALGLELVYPPDVDAFIAERYRCLVCGAGQAERCPKGVCAG